MSVSQPGVLSAPVAFSALAAIAMLVGVWWIRERRLNAQRHSMRAFHALSEGIIAAASSSEIAEKLARVLPTITQATAVRLYLLNRRTKSLERVPTSGEPEPMAVPIEAPQDGLPSGAVVCLRNRSLLNIPDVRRSPFIKAASQSGLPRSAMFVPLAVRDQVLGVLMLLSAESGRAEHRQERTSHDCGPGDSKRVPRQRSYLVCHTLPS